MQQVLPVAGAFASEEAKPIHREAQQQKHNPLPDQAVQPDQAH